MLIDDLGLRAVASEPDPALSLTLERSRAAGDNEAVDLIPSAVLHGEPLISFSGITPRQPLGLASACGRTLRARRAWFLLSPTWVIEPDDGAAEAHRLAVRHRSANPGHNLVFVVNSPEELEILQRQGEAAFFFNKTATAPEWIFKPIENAPPAFDAIYNAQLVRWKRHELSLAIESCAFLFYRGKAGADAGSVERNIMARHAGLPGHLFLNHFDHAGRPVRFTPLQVNAQLSRACVGLCLSEKEGAMFASMEYLLAGLPIVTTPNAGGRNVYYDPEYCWTVPPDTAAIAAAVLALKARQIPRNYIREKTLRRIELDRARFLDFLNAILAEGRTHTRLAGPWPFRKPVTMEWWQPQEAVDRAVHGIVDAFGDGRRHFPPWRLRRWFLRMGRRLSGLGLAGERHHDVTEI